MSQPNTAYCSYCQAPLHDGMPDEMCARCLLTTALLPPPEDQAWLSAAGSPEALLSRKSLGGYQLVSEIARGGMGVVFKAQQKRPAREVALKVIGAGALASKRAVERFRREAQAAAQLEHPNIASVYEVGEEDGWHYFSMRLLHGGTLAHRLMAGPVNAAEAARLVVKIARAVHHAHQRAILHRDLKPANVLLDEAGEPHLTDFGLAKITERDGKMTHSEAILGTPAYMAPEQATGGTRDVTIAADVYGLGAIFYEMFAARPPFSGANQMEVLRRVCEAEPEPLPPSVPQDLNIICLRCLEKDPERRYASAAEFADDVERWLRSEPIMARRSSGWDRLVKWARRRPAYATLAGTALLALAVISGGSLWFNVKLSRANALARKNAEQVRNQLLSQNLREAARLTSEDEGVTAMLTLAEAARLETTSDLSMRRLSAVLNFSPRLLRLWDAEGSPTALRFSSDGQRLVATLRDEARAWNLASGKRVAVGPEDLAPASKVSLPPKLSSDGRWQLAVRDGSVALTEVSSGRLAAKIAITGPLYDFGFSPDLRFFATAGFRDQARIFKLPTGEPLRGPIVHESGANRVEYSPDGRLLATAGLDYRLRLWHADDLRVAAPALRHNALVEAITFSADARFLASADAAGVVRIWDLYAPAAQWCGQGRMGQPSPFSNDRKLIATPDRAGHVWFYRIPTGEPACEPLTVEPGVKEAMFDATGARLVTWGNGPTGVVIWDLAKRGPILQLTDEPGALSVLWRPGANELICVRPDGVARRRHAITGEVIGKDMQVGGKAGPVAMSNDGRWLVIAVGPEATLWDVERTERVGEILHGPGSIAAMEFTRDSRRLAIAFSNDSIEPSWAQVFAVPTLQPVSPPLRHGDGVSVVCFSPDETLIATGGEDNLARIWRIADGAPVTPSMRHVAIVDKLAFTPDGKILVTGSHDGQTRFWDTRRGELMAPPFHSPNIREIYPTTDGTHLLTGFAGHRPVILPMPEYGLSTAAWARLAACATGSRLTPDSGAVPIPAGELAAEFAGLWTDHPELFAWPADSTAWHRFQAGFARAVGRTFTTAFHEKRAAAQQ